MKQLIILLMAFSVLFRVQAQQSGKVVHSIKGKVVDEATNEPVSYTNIGLEDTFYGTASNAEGNFELKITEEMVSKNIYFSAVGFKNQKFPVSLLFGKEFNVIKLESQSYGIDDIDIAAQSKVLIRILRMAAENIPYNFIGGPLNLICKYENVKTTDDTISISQNASVVIFDETGYAKPSKINAFQSLKYSVKKDKPSTEDYRFSTGTTQMDALLELDWVRSGSSVLNPALLPGFQLKLEDEPVLGGTECWLISFKQIPPTFTGSGDFYATAFEGRVTIGKNDYSVKKIEGKVLSSKNNRQGRSLAVDKVNSNYLSDVSYDFQIQYNNLKPDYIFLNKKYLSEGKKVSEQLRLTVLQVQTTDLKVLKGRDYFTGE